MLIRRIGYLLAIVEGTESRAYGDLLLRSNQSTRQRRERGIRDHRRALARGAAAPGTAARSVLGPVVVFAGTPHCPPNRPSRVRRSRTPRAAAAVAGAGAHPRSAAPSEPIETATRRAWHQRRTSKPDARSCRVRACLVVRSLRRLAGVVAACEARQRAPVEHPRRLRNALGRSTRVPLEALALAAEFRRPRFVGCTTSR